MEDLRVGNLCVVVIQLTELEKMKITMTVMNRTMPRYDLQLGVAFSRMLIRTLQQTRYNRCDQST